MAKKKPAEQPADEAAHDTNQPAATGHAGNGNGGKKPPVHEARIGRLKVVIWANESAKDGTWYSINLIRSYKDGEGQWKQSNSFGRDDLLPAAELLRLAFLQIATLTGSTPYGNRPATQQQNVDDCPL